MGARLHSSILLHPSKTLSSFHPETASMPFRGVAKYVLVNLNRTFFLGSFHTQLATNHCLQPDLQLLQAHIDSLLLLLFGRLFSADW